MIRLDTISVEPESIVLTPDIPFEFDAATHSIRISTSSTDSLEVCYRVILPLFFEPVYIRDIKTYSRGRVSRQPDASHTPWPGLQEEEIFSFGSVDSYGAITRGITFGNRQNLFVNSSLNLQMDGALTDNLNVSAVITDQNIPYQPEGNTQQIRDFDNVYIKLYNEDFSVVAGDVVLQNPVADSYFLKYYKNVQGLQLQYDYQLSDKWRARSQLSGAVAKGQFASAVIEPAEGVQGPYKLRGMNGERFIVVLANSEKVFVDGELMQRGFDRDYVIDYNLGEITFSANVVITRFSRIQVDYEYADQYYVRSNLTAVQELKSEMARVYFNFYREKDNAASTLGFSPGEEDLDQLRKSGDQRGRALISGVDSTGFVDNTVLYKRVDTINADGNPVSIFVHGGDPGEAIFRVTFSEVGPGNGDYTLGAVTANGRVYTWVSPAGGVSRGSYAPVQQIPTPNQKQLMVMGTDLKLGSHETFFQELAVSAFDQNLYSPLDDNDNQGLAWRGGIRSAGREVGFMPDYTLVAAFDYEFDHRNFRAIDRFRSVDYDRDWSYNVFSDTVGRQDQILNASVGLMKDARNALSYRFSHRVREEVIAGTQHHLLYNQEIGPLLFHSENFYSINAPNELGSSWLRLSEGMKITSWKIQPGYQLDVDRHVAKNTETDSVMSTLMNFVAHDIFVESADSLRTKFRVDYIRRLDRLPVEGELRSYTEAEEFRVGFSGSYYKTQSIGVELNYRKVEEQIMEQATERNLLGKLDWSGHFFADLLGHSLVYSTANVRELKREFVFLRVATGEGTHTWRDDNGDDVQDLEEFYEAINPDEKNFIKLFTPTDEYVNAYQTSLVHSVDLRFPAKWKQRRGVLHELSKLSFNRNIRYNYKTTDSSPSGRMIPFGHDLTSDDLLFYRSLEQSTLFYNRNAPGFGLDLTQTGQHSKSLLSSGFEISEKRDWSGAARFGFGHVFTIRSKGGWGTSFNSSNFLSNRNFELKRNNASLEFVWQLANSFRMIAGYERRAKHTVDSEIDGNSLISDYHVETTWIRTTKGNLNASFSWLNIDFEGEQNSFLAYELLEALQPGANQRWRVNWQQSLRKGLQLFLQYNGRKSSAGKAIHTGTMQVTAYF